MLRYWKHQLLEQRLYCPTCKAITSHSILAREPIYLRGDVPAGIPLVCQCNICESFFVAFSHEIYFENISTNAEEYAKLLTQNRLTPGDWIYLDGKMRPARVTGIYQTRTEEVVVADADGQQEKLTRPILSRFNESAPQGFRLLPAQIGCSLLGDPVYHVLRKMIGRAVGRVVDNAREKLVVQLENGKVLFITLPDELQTLPDIVLLRRLTDAFFKKFPDMKNSLRLNVVHNVAYIYGPVSNLPQKENVLRFMKMQTDYRGVVDMVSVYCLGDPVPDSEVLNNTYDILEKEGCELFNYEVRVENGTLFLNAYYFPSADLEKAMSALRNIRGLRDLKLELEEVCEAAPVIRSRAEILRAQLRTQYDKCLLHVVPLSDGILVEGAVKSILQKSLVNLFVVRNANGIKVNTRLRVSD